MSASHRIGTGSVPAARAVSWSCTCGAAQVIDYGLTVDETFALRVAAARAGQHIRRTGVRLP